MHLISRRSPMNAGRRSPIRSALPLLLVAVALTPLPAGALFHFWDITEVYSNADGSVQYVEWFTDINFQDELIDHTFSSSATATTYTFPTDLDPDINGNGNNNTANRHFLIATPAFASQPGAVTPDFVFDAANFHSTVADTLGIPLADTITWGSGELPTDGVDALHEDFGGTNRRQEANSPTNFAGEVGSLPEPPGLVTLVAGAAGVLGLARRRRGSR